MLVLENVSFQYSKNTTVLNDINFTLQKGEHLCIMGESGGGKSTLLKSIYGLLDVNEGNISWDNETVLGPKDQLVPGFSKFKYVAQDLNLMPYTSVSENIKKHLSRFFPKESEERTQELLEVIEMQEFANTKVKNLSGGQKQRVTIAKALAKEPELLLLDEPFSQIDNFRKNTLRRRLFSYLKSKNIACIVATHDKEDALSFADYLLILKNNKIEVYNSPQEIYKNPKSKYVASLFDEVNELGVKGATHYFYPHQLEIINDNNSSKDFLLEGEVVNSYFKGNSWLIEINCKNKNYFVLHEQSLSVKTIVKIRLSQTNK